VSCPHWLQASMNTALNSQGTIGGHGLPGQARQ
jgi:hypothetical protein